MTEPQMVPTTPKPAAGLVAWGLAFTGAGGALLLAGLLTTLGQATAYDDPGQPLTAVGVVGLGAGLALLAVGVYRLVEHVDRLGGVRFPGAPAAAGAPGEVTDAS